MNGSRGEGRVVLALELPPATTRAQSSFLVGVKSQRSQEAAFKDDATAITFGGQPCRQTLKSQLTHLFLFLVLQGPGVHVHSFKKEPSEMVAARWSHLPGGLLVVNHVRAN
jgi:hypothetical protein